LWTVGLSAGRLTAEPQKVPNMNFSTLSG